MCSIFADHLQVAVCILRIFLIPYHRESHLPMGKCQATRFWTNPSNSKYQSPTGMTNGKMAMKSQCNNHFTKQLL